MPTADARRAPAASGVAAWRSAAAAWPWNEVLSLTRWPRIAGRPISGGCTPPRRAGARRAGSGMATRRSGDHDDPQYYTSSAHQGEPSLPLAQRTLQLHPRASSDTQANNTGAPRGWTQLSYPRMVTRTHEGALQTRHRMLALRWNTFSGSYFVLTAASRSYLAP